MNYNNLANNWAKKKIENWGPSLEVAGHGVSWPKSMNFPCDKLFKEDWFQETSRKKKEKSRARQERPFGQERKREKKRKKKFQALQSWSKNLVLCELVTSSKRSPTWYSYSCEKVTFAASWNFKKKVRIILLCYGTSICVMMIGIGWELWNCDVCGVSRVVWGCVVAVCVCACCMSMVSWILCCVLVVVMMEFILEMKVEWIWLKLET